MGVCQNIYDFSSKISTFQNKIYCIASNLLFLLEHQIKELNAKSENFAMLIFLSSLISARLISKINPKINVRDLVGLILVMMRPGGKNSPWLRSSPKIDTF